MLTLTAAASTDYDKTELPMTSWDSLSRNFYSNNVLSIFYNAVFLFDCRNVVWIGTYLNSLAFNQISYIFDTTSTFIECSKKAEQQANHVSNPKCI